MLDQCCHSQSLSSLNLIWFNSRTHFTGLDHLNFDDDLLSSLNFLLNMEPADVCASSGENENVCKDVKMAFLIIICCFSVF